MGWNWTRSGEVQIGVYRGKNAECASGMCLPQPLTPNMYREGAEAKAGSLLGSQRICTRLEAWTKGSVGSARNGGREEEEAAAGALIQSKRLGYWV